MRYLNLTATGEDSHDILARVLAAVHGFNASRPVDARIAISFPSAQEVLVDERGKVVQHARPGAQLRLFGTEAALTEFAASATPARLVKLGAMVRGAVSRVPAGAGATRFVRDRRFERQHANGAYARRQAARAAARGEVAPTRRKTLVGGFGFKLRSQSTEHSFHLDIRKEPATGTVSLSNITAYGLCGDGAAVPVF